MAKPLNNAEIGQPRDMQFAHFGVLNDGAQSKASTMTAVIVNIALAFVIVVVGAATKKTIDKHMKLTDLVAPVEIKPIEPIKPKIVPPKVMPKVPETPKLEVQPPKIIVPEVKLPELPKQVVKMEEPKPVLAPAPPKQVIAMAAPQAVNLKAAPPALANNDAHPSAVALGRPDNPLAPSNAGPAKVDLGNRGVGGMPSSNTGNGAPTKVNLAGSGSPGGQNKGTGPVAVTGLAHGVTGGTGTNPHATGVNLAQATPPPMPKPAGPAATAPTAQHQPKVISKPKPEYSAEAIQMHLEGTVTVHIHVLPNGSVEVVGITEGLGHGLDDSARRAAQATRFEPATDASGHPIEWDGFVKVAFQLAG